MKYTIEEINYLKSHLSILEEYLNDR